jgi:hypothetical protein
LAEAVLLGERGDFQFGNVTCWQCAQACCGLQGGAAQVGAVLGLLIVGRERDVENEIPAAGLLVRQARVTGPGEAGLPLVEGPGFLHCLCNLVVVALVLAETDRLDAPEHLAHALAVIVAVAVHEQQRVGRRRGSGQDEGASVGGAARKVHQAQVDVAIEGGVGPDGGDGAVQAALLEPQVLAGIVDRQPWAREA